MIYRTSYDTQNVRRLGERLFQSASLLVSCNFRRQRCGPRDPRLCPSRDSGRYPELESNFSSLLGGPWVAVAQNVDDDLTWTCPTNPAPEGFMERFRAVVEKE